MCSPTSTLFWHNTIHVGHNCPTLGQSLSMSTKFVRRILANLGQFWSNSAPGATLVDFWAVAELAGVVGGQLVGTRSDQLFCNFCVALMRGLSKDAAMKIPAPPPPQHDRLATRPQNSPHARPFQALACAGEGSVARAPLHVRGSGGDPWRRPRAGRLGGIFGHLDAGGDLARPLCRRSSNRWVAAGSLGDGVQSSASAPSPARRRR